MRMPWWRPWPPFAAWEGCRASNWSASTTTGSWRSWRRPPGTTLEDDAVGLAHAIYRETDGNPFFVSEVLRHLVETGAIAQRRGGSLGSGCGP